MNYYGGIDHGTKGAIAVIAEDASEVYIWDIPMTKGSKARHSEVDLHQLRRIFAFVRKLAPVSVGLEWSTTRPGEGAFQSERFGRCKGYLEAFAFLACLPVVKVPPQRWKKKLALPGKTKPFAIERSAALYDSLFPKHTHLIRQRTAIKDGRCDAALIAHYQRLTHGKD